VVQDVADFGAVGDEGNDAHLPTAHGAQQRKAVKSAPAKKVPAKKAATPKAVVANKAPAKKAAVKKAVPAKTKKA
jgi:hypothetical protein